MQIKIFKIKQGKEEVLRAWGKEIRNSMDEAVASLAEENCLEETLRLFELGGRIYGVGIMCAEKGKEILPSNKNRELNQKHRAILKECVEEVVSNETIYSVVVK